jgi:Fe-S-cluster containining protein
VELTRAYTARHGATFNRDDFDAALHSIHNNIVEHETQKIKLARTPDGAPIAMIYDCESCPHHGEVACSTILTLDDLQRLVEQTGHSWERLFGQFIDRTPDPEGGTMHLKRDEHCVFFDPETRGCSVEEARPTHCRFTPCPLRTQDGETFSRLYLGSGRLEEQFRHQVAMEVTREYIREHGMKYHRKGIRAALQRLEALAADREAFKTFLEQVAPVRYLNDAEQVLREFEPHVCGFTREGG